MGIENARSFVRRVQNFAHSRGLWNKGAKIIIGVSGGADSTALLSVLAFLKEKYAFSLHVAHVNYGLRGKSSDEDEKFVRDLAQKKGITISVLRVKENFEKANLEEKLREIRYAFFEKERKKRKFDLIAVAHNQNDQAETLLLRLLRGAAAQGLGAMRPRSGALIRPFLGTSRAEIEDFLRKQGQGWRTDATNKELRFFRNKVRQKLIPYLESNFNPAISSVLARTAEVLAQEQALVLQQTEEVKSFSRKIKGGWEVDVSGLLEKQLPFRRQALRFFSSSLLPAGKGWNFAQLEETEKIIKSRKSKVQKALIGGLRVERKGDKIKITSLK